MDIFILFKFIAMMVGTFFLCVVTVVFLLVFLLTFLYEGARFLMKDIPLSSLPNSEEGAERIDSGERL